MLSFSRNREILSQQHSSTHVWIWKGFTISSVVFLFVAELTAAHFGGGGGLLRKKAPSGQQDEEEEKPKSRKELIEEMIAKSKQEKVSF